MLLMEYDYPTDIEVQQEEAFQKGVSQGISQGEHQAKIETAKKFLTMGISIEQVSQGTGLSVDEITKLM